jgi:TPP-dependent pyruvate/acetoin dehydrogenase alpha subunit
MNESKEVIDFVKKNQTPAFLRVKTMRYKEHVGPGEDLHIGYRSQIEMDNWKSKDPLISNQSLDEIATKIKLEIEEAISFAYNSPFPTQADLLTDVY